MESLKKRKTSLGEQRKSLAPKDGLPPKSFRARGLAYTHAELRSELSQGTSVSPAVLVDLDPKTFWHARHFTFASSVAGWAGGASAATAAGVRAVPRAVRVVLANPAEVVTIGA